MYHCQTDMNKKHDFHFHISHDYFMSISMIMDQPPALYWKEIFFFFSSWKNFNNNIICNLW